MVAGCTAVASGLLLVAIAITRVTGSPYGTGCLTVEECQVFNPANGLFAPIADPGTRAGAVFGVVLMTVPFLLLLDQAVRLGASARERRYAALTVAGATRRELGRWGALEVGAPAALGAALGGLVYLFLGWALSGPHMGSVGSMVPTRTGPGWWGLLAVLALTAYGVWVGRRAGGRAADAWMTWRGVRGAPRPWSLLFLVLAVLAEPVLRAGSPVDSQVIGIGLLVLVVLGLVGLAPWASHLAARVVLPRTSSAAMMLAARRLMADPRPAGRAAAAVGAVTFAGVATIGFVVDLGPVSQGQWDVQRATSVVLVGVVVVLSMFVVAGTMAVHATEMLLSRRRQLSALVATGVPEAVVARSLRHESLLATLPLGGGGAVLGAVGYAYVTHNIDPLRAGAMLLGVLLVVGLLFTAVLLTARLLRPWLREAVRPLHLRTE